MSALKNFARADHYFNPMKTGLFSIRNLVLFKTLLAGVLHSALKLYRKYLFADFSENPDLGMQ